tara:strand:- start:2476 stop:3315 length:840 start_codon:yes stop_codon:yes gene_type:complete
MKLGIVGLGYVGGAVFGGMSERFEIETFDLNKKSTCQTLEELCTKVELIFICVPTPMERDGGCDISIVEDAISKINESSCNLAVIKSTVPPGTTEALNNKYKNLSIVFSPEFLTEANYLKDFVECNRIIVGGPRPATTKVKNIFRKRFPRKAIIKTHSTIAEMVKYLTNTFLSTKVSFANEMKQICDSLNTDYDKVLEYALYDTRLGDSHWSVPGPDGHPGFGGSCFPKDLNALLRVAKENEVNSIILESVWNKNLEVRPEKDWEKLVGRAIKEEKNNG